MNIRRIGFPAASAFIRFWESWLRQTFLCGNQRRALVAISDTDPQELRRSTSHIAIYCLTFLRRYLLHGPYMVGTCRYCTSNLGS